MKHTHKRIMSIFAAAALTVCALPQQIVLKANAAGTVKLSGNTLTLSGAFTKEQLDAYCSSNAVTSILLMKNGERLMSKLTDSSTHC